ncbi:carbohydrate kinase [Lyngbya sp. PCC 8106]|uniref:carbohydrate kinase family protein n=1 Tax=Lyngbya sp. (strain PCC 8106) TaxID=313612 RepID=UPI0000EAC154|nr:PfkB [Lyngbya sp. PCC 8106]
MIMINPARVLCIGEILFDCLADQTGRSLEQVASWTAYPGGAPANVACGLVKLGIPTGFIGVVGMDEAGMQLVQLLRQVGVETTGIQQYPAPTRKVFVLRSDDGEREFAGFGKPPTNEFADTHLQASQIPESLFVDADFLVLGTIALAYPESRQACIQALKMADRYNLKILVDINWRPVFWSNPLDAQRLIPDLLKQVDFVKVSTEEAKLFFNTTDPISIHSQFDSIEGVIITDGQQGCAYSLGEFQGKIPAFAVNVEDTTGAGDGFVAGFIHQIYQYGIRGLNDPETIQKMITYASAVGALTVTKPGAISAQPTADEVEVFLKSV